MLWVFGVLAGALQAFLYVPYVRDVLRSSTRPHRGTWGIWCILSVIVLASQRADGGRWSLMVVVAQLVGTSGILVLSIKRGVGGATRVDLALLGVAAAGLVGWYVAGDPTVATICVVLADSAAVVMMLPKTWADPYSETLSAFAMSALSGFLAMAAVGSLNAGLLLYPAYFTIADLLVVGIIVRQRTRVARIAVRS
jgi:hypothetical protein